MKKIEAIIRPEKVDAVMKALEKSGYPGISIIEVEGHGKQKGMIQQWRGEKFRIELLPKVKVEIVVTDKDLDRILDSVVQVARTGSVGDGKIFVTDVKEAVRIRTGEKGEVAVS